MGRYKASERGYIGRIVEAGEEFEHDGPKGSWMIDLDAPDGPKRAAKVDAALPKPVDPNATTTLHAMQTHSVALEDKNKALAEENAKLKEQLAQAGEAQKPAGTPEADGGAAKVDTTPAETTPAETTPAETTPAETKPAGKPSGGKK